MSSVTLITVNYNGFSDTCGLIDSVFRYGYQIEIVVVDNGSSVNEAEVLRERYDTIKVIRSDKNLGFAGGNNLGIKHATGKFLLFLNNDTVVTSGFLEPLINRLDSGQSIGMACPKIKYSYAPDTIQSTGFSELSRITLRNTLIGEREIDRGQYEEPRAIPFAHGAAMLVKREVIDKVGLMPEEYFLYYEELDWCLSIRNAGYSIWYEPQSTIYHKESASTGRLSSLKNYYMTRNRIYFAKRNITGIFLYLSLGYLLLVSLPKRCTVAVLQQRFDIVGSTVRGIYDGFFKMKVSGRHL